MNSENAILDALRKEVSTLQSQNKFLYEAVQQGHNIRKKYNEAMDQFIQKDRELKKQKDEYKTINERLESILATINDTVFTVDATSFELKYIASDRLFGYEVDYSTPHFWLDIISEDDRESVIFSLKNLKNTIRDEIEYRIVCADKSFRWVHTKMSLRFDAEHSYITLIISDVTQNKLYEEKLFYLVYNDTLTGLPNKTKLTEDINYSTRPILAIVEIDSFSEVNRIFGYDVGDNILKQISDFFKSTLVQYSSLYKIYKLQTSKYAILGDCFDNSSFIKFIKEFLFKMKNESFLCNNNTEIGLISTAGVAFCNSEFKKDLLLANADIALDFAKQRNYDLYIFDSNLRNSINSQYEANRSWTKKLKWSIENDGIIPHFQPIIDNITNEITKYEALARLIDNTNTINYPGEFLQIDKKTKYYTSITKEIITKSLNKFQHSDKRVSINLSLEDIMSDDIVSFLSSTISKYQMTNRIIFELLETDSFDKVGRIEEFIKEAKGLGALIAIDDFGTGYSNFAYLMKLNVDIIKIDGSLIKNIDKDKNSEIITKTIVNFSKDLGLSTVAEFVHSSSIFEKVKEIGVDFSQGFFIGKPSDRLS